MNCMPSDPIEKIAIPSGRYFKSHSDTVVVTTIFQARYSVTERNIAKTSVDVKKV
jgi:hypothetical protein